MQQIIAYCVSYAILDAGDTSLNKTALNQYP